MALTCQAEIYIRTGVRYITSKYAERLQCSMYSVGRIDDTPFSLPTTLGGKSLYYDPSITDEEMRHKEMTKDACDHTSQKQQSQILVFAHLHHSAISKTSCLHDR